MSLFSATAEDLFEAVIKGDATRVTKLLSKGVYVDVRNKGGNTPLLTACSSGSDNADVIQTLLDKGANVNQRTETDSALIIAHRMLAARYGWSSDSNLQPAMRTLVGKSDGLGGGSTPLMYASAFGLVRVVQTLLAYPLIDVAVVNKAGATALSIARAEDSSKHKAIVDMLQKAGASA
jgi:uncharacterized protein